MKLIKNSWNQSKSINYKGLDLCVPVWTKWVATDAAGFIWAFQCAPTKKYRENGWQVEWEDTGIGAQLLVAEVEFDNYPVINFDDYLQPVV